jgi:hypothetical protein
VERDALPQGQGASGVTQVVEADLYRVAGLLKEESVGNVDSIRTIQGTPQDVPVKDVDTGLFSGDVVIGNAQKRKLEILRKSLINACY